MESTFKLGSTVPMRSFTISKNGSKTFTAPSDWRGLIIVCGVPSNASGAMWTISQGTRSGSPGLYAYEIIAKSEISVTTDGLNFTIANANPSWSVRVLMITASAYSTPTEVTP